MDIIVEPSHQQLSNTCAFKDNEPEVTIEVGPQNIVIVSVGSVMSGAKTLNIWASPLKASAGLFPWAW